MSIADNKNNRYQRKNVLKTLQQGTPCLAKAPRHGHRIGRSLTQPSGFFTALFMSLVAAKIQAIRAKNVGQCEWSMSMPLGTIINKPILYLLEASKYPKHMLWLQWYHSSINMRAHFLTSSLIYFGLMTMITINSQPSEPICFLQRTIIKGGLSCLPTARLVWIWPNK